jgi:hypothetical protein
MQPADDDDGDILLTFLTLAPVGLALHARV